MSTDKIGSGPACDGTKLFIEVTGVDHDPNYSIQFYHSEEDSRNTQLEEKKICQALGDTSVYSWACEDATETVNAFLSIPSDSGEIKLPLFENAKPKKRVDGEQDYLLHAVVPLTLLPTYNEKLTEKDRYAPSRNGYFYVFYNHKAWREIEMRTPEGGPVVFKDVDLAAYRTGENDTFSSEQRDTTGSPLTEIWLPIKDNNKSTVVHLAYSDVPWSGERLNYLEANVSELIERAQSLHKLNGIENAPKNRKSESHVLQASELPEMRAREPEFEWFVAEPVQLNRDVSGGWLSTQYQAVKQAISDSNDGSKVMQIEHSSPFQYEYGMKQAALKSLIDKDDAIDKDWEADAGSDFLADAKARQLRTLVLDDPLFDLIHSSFICSASVSYMQQVYVDMSKQEFYQTAELTQQLILPPRFGKNDNPLYKYKDDLNQSLSGRFKRTLRSAERQIANHDVRELQEVVQETLNNKRTATVLRDVSSLNTKNAAMAYSIPGYALSALSVDIDSIDTFAQYDSYSKNRLTRRGRRTQKVAHRSSESHMRVMCSTLEKILTSKSHPLHTVLFVPEGGIPLDQEYTVPDAVNDGSGEASPESLAQWSVEDFLDDTDEPTHDDVDLLSINKLNTSFDEAAIATGAFAQVRRTSNVLDNILKGFFEAAMALKNLESDAKVIKFNNAYSSVLGLAKATNANQLGKMTFTTVSGASTEFYTLGVHTDELSYGLSADDKDYVKNKSRKGLQGSLVDENGRLVVSSKKKPFDKIDKPHISGKGPLKVVGFPADSELVQSFNHANTQRALRNYGKEGLHSSNAYQKVKLPYWITVIETVNLLVNFKHAQNYVDGKDKAYSIANAGSAALDLSIAITHATKFYLEQASGSAAQEHAAQVKASSGNPRSIASRVSKNSMKTLASRAFGLLKIGAGVLTAGLALWDGIRLWSENDTDAALSMFTVAAGGLVSVLSGFITTTPILFGLGPIAWLGIALAVVGTAAYFYFVDTPIEKWLKNGPFADDPADKYAHLQDNKVAFERLVNCLMSVDMKAYKYGTQTALPDAFNAAMKAKGVTHAIQINSNLASLLNQEDIKLDFYANAAIEETRKNYSRRDAVTMETVTIRPTGQKAVQVVHTQASLGGFTVFVKDSLALPKKEPATHFKKAYLVRARWTMGESIYPTLPLDEKEAKDKPSDTPKFTEDEKFWLNQEVIVGSAR